MAGLIRFTPQQDMLRLQREIDQVFNTFWPARQTESAEGENAVWTPRVDFAETDDAYLFQLDVPGVEKDALDINYHEGTLSVSGERTFSALGEDAKYLRVERAQGRFYRAFALPKLIDVDRIEATYTNGVLSLRVGKAEEGKPRKISVS